VIFLRRFSGWYACQADQCSCLSKDINRDGGSFSILVLGKLILRMISWSLSNLVSIGSALGVATELLVHDGGGWGVGAIPISSKEGNTWASLGEECTRSWMKESFNQHLVIWRVIRCRIGVRGSWRSWMMGLIPFRHNCHIVDEYVSNSFNKFYISLFDDSLSIQGKGFHRCYYRA
jgi:hypothetical protein